MTSPRRRGSTALAVGATMMVVGVGWYVIELVLALASERGLLLPSAVTAKWLRLFPWQIALFGLLALGAAAFAALVELPRRWQPWLALWLSSVVLLDPRIGEGLLRNSGALHAFRGAGLGAFVLGIVLLVLALLFQNRRPAARWSIWIAYSIAFLCILRRLGAAFSLGDAGLLGTLRLIRPEDLLLGPLVGLALFLVARLGKRLAIPATGILALVYASGTPARPSPAPGDAPNVLIVLVDTLRADHAPPNSDDGKGLAVLARESIVFKRAFAPSNLTRRSMPGIFTSLPWRVTGEPLPNDLPLIPSVLKKAGYSTVGVSANPYVSREFGYDRGFDILLDPTTENSFAIAGLLRIAGAAFPEATYRIGIVTAALYYSPIHKVWRQGLALSKDRHQPVFIYLHTMDPHGPYLPPRQYLPQSYDDADLVPFFRFNALAQKGVLQSPGFAPRLRNLRQRYTAEVHYTGRELDKMIQALRASGRWDDTLVWVLADHGEAFGEHDFAGHGGPNLTPTLVHVPLMLKLPKSWGVAPRVEYTPVSTYDVLPTTMSLLGLDVPDGLFGEDLAGLVRTGKDDDPGRTLVSYAKPHGEDWYSAIRWPWKLDVCQTKNGVRRKLFDLKRDPGEMQDVLSEHPDVVRELEAELAAWRSREDAHRHGGSSEIIDPKTHQMLRNLGYVE